MRKYGFLAAIPVLALLAGCGSFEAQQDMASLEKREAVGTPFTKALTDEYRDFARFEYVEMWDWPDADYFASKGLKTSTGTVVPPEELEAWNLPSSSKPDLAEARAGLVKVLEAGAGERAPKEAARAQAKFDCWVEQQEENWQWDHIAACRDAFKTAMADLEEALRPPPKALAFAPKEEKVEVPEPPKVRTPYVLFFEFDKSDLTPTALETLDRLATDIRENKVTKILIAGHADRAGPAAYNVGLSQRRATTVAQALSARNIPYGFMNLEAYGESKPMVETPDGQREARNRVVVVKLAELPPQAASE